MLDIEFVVPHAQQSVQFDVHDAKPVGHFHGPQPDSVGGEHLPVNTKHLDRYLEELEWRFNNRDNPYIFRDTLARIMRT